MFEFVLCLLVTIFLVSLFVFGTMLGADSPTVRKAKADLRSELTKERADRFATEARLGMARRKLTEARAQADTFRRLAYEILQAFNESADEDEEELPE